MAEYQLSRHEPMSRDQYTRDKKAPEHFQVAYQRYQIVRKKELEKYIYFKLKYLAIQF